MKQINKSILNGATLQLRNLTEQNIKRRKRLLSSSTILKSFSLKLGNSISAFDSLRSAKTSFRLRLQSIYRPLTILISACSAIPLPSILFIRQVRLVFILAVLQGTQHAQESLKSGMRHQQCRSALKVLCSIENLSSLSSHLA